MADHNYNRRRSGPGPDRRRSRSPGPVRGYNGRANDVQARVIDPFTMTDHVSYDYFCRWYQTLNPGTNIDDSMRDRYDDYTTDLVARTGKAYVVQQAAIPWFQDYYSPQSYTAELMQEAAQEFRQDLSQGTYDAFNITQKDGQNPISMDDKRSPDTRPGEGEVVSNIVRINSIPPSIGRRVLETKVSEVLPGFRALSISAPTLDQAFRIGWVVFDATSTSSEDAVAKLEGLQVDDPVLGKFPIQVSQFRSNTRSEQRLLWSQLNDEGQVEQHLAQVEEILVQKEAKLETEALWPVIKARLEKELRQQLDVGVELLRRVHAFDYWQLQQYDSLMDLEVHSLPYVRASEEGTQSDNSAFDRWSTMFTKKLQILLDPTTYLAQLRQKPLEETVEEVMHSKIRKEDETRYRCQVLDCTKLFKDIPFVQKHIEKRHGEWLDQVRREAELLLRYLSDPNKTLPYKEFREPKMKRAQSPNDRRNRRRSSPGRNGYGGPGGRGGPRDGRDDYRRPRAESYRDLDRPAEDLPELDY